MVLKGFRAEYPLRGWVQQEISFTNLQYCITPLQQNWFHDHQDFVDAFSNEQKHEPSDLDIPSFNKAVSESIPYFNVLSRATEGRTSEEAKILHLKVAELMSLLQKYAFMFGSYGRETLADLLKLKISLTGKLDRREYSRLKSRFNTSIP